MDKEKEILKLSTQIDTIKAHVNRLKKSGYSIHSLDIDMLRQKTIEFYELVFELENLISENEASKKIVSHTPEIPIPEVEDEHEETEVINEPEIIEKKVVVEKTIIPEPVAPPEPEPIPEPVVIQSPPVEEVIENKVAKPVTAPVPTEKKESDTIPVSSLFNDSSNSSIVFDF